MIPHHRFDGPEDAPVLVMSNSLATTYEMWDPQLPALTEDFRVLRYDRRGHGRSDVPAGPYRVDDLGGDLLELLDSLGLERVSLCGLSIGGVDTMWLSANPPDRVDRLVLCCTAAKLGTPEMWEERAATARGQGVDALADATLERWFSPAYHASEPRAVAHYREMVAATPPEGYAGCCAALAEWDFRARLGEIRAPTLVVAGEDDPATPPDLGREIADGVPGARLHVFPGARHLVNIEQPMAFDRAILEHLLG